MSRTRKDVPYWVRLNRDGIYTEHDHTRLGKVYYRRVYLYNEDGTPVMDQKPIMRSVYEILEGRKTLFGVYNRDENYAPHVWRRFEHVEMFRGEGLRYRKDIVSEAMRLAARNNYDAELQVGVYHFHVHETVEDYRLADYCTEGEKITARRHRYPYYEIPCTPALPQGAGWWTYGTSNVRQVEHESYYGYERTRERAITQNLKNRWNSGDDIEDWDEDDVYTKKTRSYLYW